MNASPGALMLIEEVREQRAIASAIADEVDDAILDVSASTGGGVTFVLRPPDD